MTPEIAFIRGIAAGRDSLRPNRHPDIASIDELLDMVEHVRAVTGKPVGVKTAIGGTHFMDELRAAILRRGLHAAPDFLTLDGGEGGSGAAPQALADHMALSIDEALPLVVDALIAGGLKERIRVIASGATGDAGPRCLGAGGRRRFREYGARVHVCAGLHSILALPYQYLPDRRCHAQPPAQRGLVVEDKAARVTSYCRNMIKEVEMIAHSCGLFDARGLRREHVRIVQASGQSVALDVLVPYPAPATSS